MNPTRAFKDENTSVNDITSAGTVVPNPDYVIELIVNGNHAHEVSPYGGLGPVTENTLDYAVHRIKGVTLGSTQDYYAENNVVIRFHYQTKSNEIKSKTVKATESDGWIEVKN